ncbi:unnamed protein product [Amoebophrya sp. A25]|nr:unnamed protein product [Amoebophrya sp. A25]|eukprot:GSA25T00001262001.1
MVPTEPDIVDGTVQLNAPGTSCNSLSATTRASYEATTSTADPITAGNVTGGAPEASSASSRSGGTSKVLPSTTFLETTTSREGLPAGSTEEIDREESVLRESVVRESVRSTTTGVARSSIMSAAPPGLECVSPESRARAFGPQEIPQVDPPRTRFLAESQWL